MARDDIQTFFTWFQQCGGDVDTAAMDIIDFPPEEGGRGAVALKNIPVRLVRVSSGLISFISDRKVMSCSPYHAP